MSEEKISKSVLEKIKAQGLKHRAKWEFVVKNVGFWSLCLLTIAAGAVAISLILFISEARRNPLGDEIYMGLLPTFWLVLFVVFFMLAIWAYHNTRGGYKISWQKLMLIFIFVIFGLGLVNHIIRGGEKFDHFLEKNVPMYSGVEMRYGQVWHVPMEGKIGGKVLNVVSGTSVQIKTFNGEKWAVVMKQQMPINRGEVWCFKGEINEDRNFVASESMVCFRR